MDFRWKSAKVEIHRKRKRGRKRESARAKQRCELKNNRLIHLIGERKEHTLNWYWLTSLFFIHMHTYVRIIWRPHALVFARTIFLTLWLIKIGCESANDEQKNQWDVHEQVAGVLENYSMHALHKHSHYFSFLFVVAHHIYLVDKSQIEFASIKSANKTVFILLHSTSSNTCNLSQI